MAKDTPDDMSLKRYDYKCLGCEELFDELVYFCERDNVRCPLCNEKTERLISCPYVLQKSMPLSAKEKGWKRDILESAKLEESLAYGQLKNADDETKKAAKKEIDRRIHD